MSLSLASIHIYPIKSLGGYSVEAARLTDRGLEHDRRWMLVDAEGRFMTQREVPELACLTCEPEQDGICVVDTRSGDLLLLPWTFESKAMVTSELWSDRVRVCLGRPEWSLWFSERLGRHLNLVFMPEASHRRIDARYADGITSMSDGFPFLIVSQASLDELNQRLEAPLPMNRFRPNLVIAGGTPFQEDDWKEITIGNATFRLVKPCARCVITTTDQRTGVRGTEPLRTLATYRAHEGKVLFGMNAVALRGDAVRVGDPVAP